MLTWSRDIRTTTGGTLAQGNIKWFVEGQLNACYNCVDRHAFADPDRVAIVFEADEIGRGRKLTYSQLLDEVCKVAWVLKQAGIKRGDTAAVYMPMLAEAVIAILACARLGIIHSVVFAGFSSNALRDCILDANCRILITADESVREGKIIGLRPVVDEALQECPNISKVLVYRRTGAHVNIIKGRDIWWHEEIKRWPCYIPPELISAEDPLFLLYTSGSTGKPKGLMHTTAGYLLGAAVTTAHVFDVREGDRFFCGGDVGWITGHTYLLYGPLLLGVSVVVFEGTLAYPNYSRYWDIIEIHKVTQLHSAPTALRMLKRAGDSHVRGDLSSLRSLGCVGEPIAAEVWKWCHDVIGKGRINIIDTYFQTETGANVLTPLADAASRDRDGYIWVRGRVDDVVNISGHRLSTAEIEAALLEHPAIAETAVVGVAHEVTGQALNAFVAVRPDYETTSDTSLKDQLTAQVRKSIGPFASPEAIYIVSDLPKTRSGKIMRRILRKVLAGEQDQVGDTTTNKLVDPSIVEKIVETVKQNL